MREQDAERPASENRNAGRLASRPAISVRPGPALLPWRIAYRAFAVSAPHLGLTLVLPELCRSTERAGLWGTRTLGFPLWSGGFCKEPKHPRRMVWQKGGPEGALRASIRPK